MIARLMFVRTILLLSVLLSSAVAQKPEAATGFVATHQALLDARNDIVVLNVAAHPDDESSRTNTVLRRKHGMRIVTVYSTYGDGGQNAISREIGPALAKIRVGETLHAASMSGAEVRWLGMTDFGFSKTLGETLKFWDEDVLKSRMRRVIDDVDPDVIITNHTLTGGHGHHRASIWAAIEILKERTAAKQYVPRLYARSGLDTSQLHFETGEVDAARGQTYARLAWAAWVQHVSQGPWGSHNPLRVGKDYWRVVYPEGVSDADAKDLTQWGVRRAGQWQIAKPELAANLMQLTAAKRKQAIMEAMSGVMVTSPFSEQHGERLGHYHQQLAKLYLAESGVSAEVWLGRQTVPRGGSGKGYVVLHGHERVTDLLVTCGGRAAEPVRQPVGRNPANGPPRAAPSAGNSKGAKPVVKDAKPAVVAAAVKSKANPLPGRFEFTFACQYGGGDELPGGPEPSFANVVTTFTLDGQPFRIVSKLPYTPVDPVSLKFEREVVLVARGQKSERLLSISVESHLDTSVMAPVQLQMGPGIQAVATPSRLELTKEQREARILVRATIDASEMTPDAGLAVGFGEGKVRLPLRLIDVTVPPGLNVGLVRGPEDSTEQTLSDLGIPFTSLDRDALVSTQLSKFSVILLGIRAYHHRPELAEVRERLQQYCRSGGRVVSMYHKPGEWNAKAGHPLLAPFALTVGNERVTEEDAVITLLHPKHRLMTHPHQIQASDFANWVQERGLNFPKTWDAAWVPMLGMKDTGEEKDHQGSLLYTNYGQGDFIYCSLSLYRQLRRGNPGAVRLLVNLLSR
ncbi:MAG: LmbE family N-acetylglucosaminyl deacetylase [Planctomycetota bacterium]|jgi:LmbE family N-acetylglucosaminyl deacetylase